MIAIWAALWVASLLALGLTRVAIRWGRLAMDWPKALAIHTEPTPRTGGLAICISFFGAAAAAHSMDWIGMDTQTAGLAVGALAFAATGFWDDVQGLTAHTRVGLELVASSIVVLCGTRMHLTGSVIIDASLTMLYLIGAANALNLLDGMNGLAAGVAAIASFFLSAIALAQGQLWCAACGLALVGCCLGFLPYNFPKATVFMGDTGSLFLGFSLGGLSIRALQQASGLQAVVAPVLLLAVPWIDTGLTVFRRLLEGRALFIGDRAHLYDRLVARGWSRTQTVMLCYGAGVVFGGTALLVAQGGGAGCWLLITVETALVAGTAWKLNLLSTEADGKRSPRKSSRNQRSQ